MKKRVLLSSLIACTFIVFLSIKHFQSNNNESAKIEKRAIKLAKKEKKKTLEEKALYSEERNLYEYYRQVNPYTGTISKVEKNREFKQAKSADLRDYNSLFAKAPQAAYTNRGPSNFGGRTRALVVDRSDNTGNTMIAGGVSGGVFRTTNGGTSWTKVSSNDEIHNVTAIVQDPRVGSENIWYYATGEGLGNSASSSTEAVSSAAFNLGQGIWQSTNGGISWTQMPSTAGGTQENFDNVFDIIYNLAVHPTTGHLYAAVLGQIRRFNGTSWTTEINGSPASTGQATDVVITSSGIVYAAVSDTSSNLTPANIVGVWTSATGIGSWSRINATDFTPFGRIVLALAPSNENKLYVLFNNGNESNCDTTPAVEADLWMWNETSDTWTNYSSKLPDETGCLDGNDPFAIQGGYDLVVSVKPNDEDFVVIGGTNAYKIEDIVNDASFIRIGGYASASNFALYANHHPDIHSLVFSPSDSNVLFSGTDGGVHRTDDITATTVAWTSLNNNYQTFQFYHVNIDPLNTSDGVIGGSQDNGTTFGGTSFSLANSTIHSAFLSGDGGACAISRDNVCTPFFTSFQRGRIFRDCPTAFTEITPRISIGVPPASDELYPSQFVTYFHLDPDNNNALYYASRGALLRTTDATNVTQDNWTNLGSPTGFGISDRTGAIPTGNEWFQTFSTTRGTYSAATSYLLMGGDGGHIYRLDDPQNATDLSGAVDITPSVPPNDATIGFPSIVTGLAIHPTNNDIVLATYSNYGINSIFLTTNATSTTPSWTLVERNLSLHSIRSAAITEVAGQTLYFVGTARGLYSTTDPTSTDWVREAPTDIGFAVVSSLVYRPSDNRLLIGTHGNGMYEATVSDVLSKDDINDISNDISLYPNPVVSTINLDIPSSNNSVTYSIANISGQLINKGTAKNNQIDVSNLTSGIYFIQMDIDGKKGIKKFIKE